ncbi:MAG: biotin/lipoyl-containing protein, partial [Nocardioidaceae bacterium]
MPVNEFKLPDVGEGLTEAEIVTWMVKVGDTIKVNDIVCEIETAKSLVELPSPYAGTVSDLLVPEGTTVEVGTPIIVVSSGADTGSTTSAEAAPAESPAAEPASSSATEGTDESGSTPTLVGYGPRATSGKRRPRKGAATTSQAAATAHEQVHTAFAPETAAEAPEAPEPSEPAVPSVSAPTSKAGVKALAKPPVRKLAKDLGVDLTAVTPTGPGGIVTRADVEGHTGGSAADMAVAPAPAQGAPAYERETRIPVKGVRKMTAEAMVASAFTAPHVTEWVTIDATRTVKLVERLRAGREFSDVKVSPLLVVARAACM